MKKRTDLQSELSTKLNDSLLLNSKKKIVIKGLNGKLESLKQD